MLQPPKFAWLIKYRPHLSTCRLTSSHPLLVIRKHQGPEPFKTETTIYRVGTLLLLFLSGLAGRQAFKISAGPAPDKAVIKSKNPEDFQISEASDGSETGRLRALSLLNPFVPDS
jgi:hypothetical protein